MSLSNLTFGVVVCTYKRKHILEQSLAHWQNSDRKPDQFLVVDATADADFYRDSLVDSYQSLFSESTSDYIISHTPGLTLQRNLGLEKMKTDIICFIDDDAFITPTYVDKIMRVFEQDTACLIGGVNGVSIGQFDNARQRYIRMTKNFFRHHFGYLAQRIHVPRSQTQLFQPLPTSLDSLPLISIDRLWGANMNYRRSALGPQRFDETFKRYGLYEDVDMSVRVGKDHKLVCLLDAELNHNDDLGKATRPSDIRYFIASWLNSAYIIEKLFPCEESRCAHQKLYQLIRTISNYSSNDQRIQKIKTLGNKSLFELVDHYLALIKVASESNELEQTFLDLQERDIDFTTLTEIR